MKSIPEYDLHPKGAKVDDAVAMLDRIVSRERGRHGMFAVVTGYGSSGGTAMIKSAVLAACRKYRRENHIRGFLDGEKAGDMFSAEALSFPRYAEIPAAYKRSGNPGVVIVVT